MSPQNGIIHDGVSRTSLYVGNAVSAFLFLYGALVLPVDRAYMFIQDAFFLLATVLFFKGYFPIPLQVKRLAFGFAFFLLIKLVSVCLGPSDWSAFFKPARALLLIPVGGLIVRYSNSRDWLFCGLSLGACVVAVSLACELNGAALPFVSGEGIDNGQVLWANRITMAEALVGVYCLLFVGLSASTRKIFYISLTGQIACIYAMPLAQSRGASLSLIVVLVFIAIFCRISHEMKIRKMGLLVLLQLVLALWWFLSSPLDGRFHLISENIRDYQESGVVNNNTGSRLEKWKESLLLARERPVFGYGEEGYRQRESELVEEGLVDDVVIRLSHFHSDYFDALVTGGIPGLFSVLFIFTLPFFVFLRRIKKLGMLSIAGMSFPLAFAVSALTDVPLKHGFTFSLYCFGMVFLSSYLVCPIKESAKGQGNSESSS